MYGFIAHSNCLVVKPGHIEAFKNFFEEAEIQFSLNFNHFDLIELKPWQKAKLQENFPTIGKVEVVNARDGLQPEIGWTDIYVDRQSPLGNPFLLGTEGDREEVLFVYEMWLYNALNGYGKLRKILLDKPAVVAPSYKYPTPLEVRTEFNRIRDLLQSGKNIRLVCWCAPLPCHANIIKRYLTSPDYCWSETRVLFTGDYFETKIKNKTLVQRQLKALVHRAYQRASEQEYNKIEFISGGAPDVDTWVFDIIQEVRQSYPEIKTVNSVTLPSYYYPSIWGKEHKKDWERITEDSDSLQVKDCDDCTSVDQLIKTDQSMVDLLTGEDDLLIAIHDGKSIKTQACVDYAQKQGKAIALFNHLTGKFSKG